MRTSSIRHYPAPGRARAAWLLAAAFVFACLAAARTSAQEGAFRLPGHVPAPQILSRPLAPVAAQEPVQLALTLPLRNQAELTDFLQRLYDPQDPEYGHYLSPAEFTDRFSPTEAQYRQVAAFAQARGLQVVGVHANRLILDVAGPAAVVERAFDTHLHRFLTPSGRAFRAPVSDPALPASMVGRISGVVGLSDLALRRPHAIPLTRTRYQAGRAAHLNPLAGSGPGGGYSPSDIRAAYNLASASQDGSGQTLALFELDGYRSSDITAYESRFSLRQVPLQNVLVDGVSGSAGSGADEVTLDIELQIALAPGAAKILVYEGPNTDQGAVDTYNQIAIDNVAKQISTSWGLAESDSSSAVLNAESTIFQQMAAQGQSIFAAAGDAGAYDNGSTLGVDDPASQPWMTGVGGTALTTLSAGGAWSSETTWNGGSINAGAGGGGISTQWSLPSYQSGLATSSNKASSTMRNVPDVSLDADPNTGYSIYYKGSWWIYGGTSAAAPLWSAFIALVNQARAAAGSATIGFVNPTLYQLGKGSRGAVDFHDIADNSTNLFYPSVTGYDCATGWGTINGANLLPDLAGSSGTGGTGSYSVSGTVSLNTGGGLSGVTVSAGGVSAVTAGDGTYTLSGVPTGAQTITPSLSGYTFSPTSRSVSVTGNLTGENFTATAITHSISGTVSLSGGGGMSGVTISAGGVSTSTASDGTYTLVGVREGTQTVRPTFVGYAFSPSSRVVSVTADLTGVNFTGSTTTYSISGTVLAGGTGLAGVSISADGVTTTTAGNGSYFLSGIAAGSITLTPSLSGYSFTPSSRTLSVSGNLTGINFTAAAQTYSVSGTVSTSGGAGIGGVTVTGGGHSAVSASDGTYTLPNLNPGTVTVTPSLTGYTFSPSSRSVTVSGNVTGVGFTALPQTYAISGTVSLSSGGGLPGVTVSVAGHSAVTGSDGAYVISGVSSGNQSVSASWSGYTFNPATRWVTVTGNLTGINFALAYSGGKLALSSRAMNFGTVKRAQARARTLTLTNTSRTGSLLVSVSTPTPGVFQLVSGGGVQTIAPRKTLKVVLQSIPSSTGTVSGTLTIRSTDPSHGTSTVALKVKGK